MLKTKNQLWAMIIIYYPDQEKLISLIKSIQKQNANIILFNNGGIESIPENNLNKHIKVLGDGSNSGIGHAINSSVEYIKKNGGTNFFIFDQDTKISKDYLINMNTAFNKINEISDTFALMPSVIDNRNIDYKYKTSLKEKIEIGTLTFHRNQKILLSGLITSVQVWEVAEYNENLFIEFVEYEWGLRCTSLNLSSWTLENENILHEVSEKAPITFLGFSFLSYKPIRRYYFSRNLIYLLKQNYVPVYFKFRLITGFFNRITSIIFLPSRRKESIYYLFLGIKDGLSNNFRKM